MNPAPKVWLAGARPRTLPAAVVPVVVGTAAGYLQSGTLVVQSKQMGMDKVATLRWDAATAQSRMENLLSAYYTKKHVDAVLSPYDGISIGILAALKGRVCAKGRLIGTYERF